MSKTLQEENAKGNRQLKIRKETSRPADAIELDAIGKGSLVCESERAVSCHIGINGLPAVGLDQIGTAFNNIGAVASTKDIELHVTVLE